MKCTDKKVNNRYTSYFYPVFQRMTDWGTTIPITHHYRQQQGSVVRECETSLRRCGRCHCAVWVECRLGCVGMSGQDQQLSESAVIRSLRRFRDRYFPNATLTPVRDTVKTAEQPQPGYVDSLPVKWTPVFFSFTECPNMWVWFSCVVVQ